MNWYCFVFEDRDGFKIEDILNNTRWGTTGLDEGKIHLLCGSAIRPGQIMHYKDIICGEVLEGLDYFEVKPEKVDLKIIYEDDDILVVSKPANMQTIPSKVVKSNTLVNALLYYCGEENLSPAGNFFPWGVCHRLDHGTSGLIIVAKNNEAAFGIKKQFFEKNIIKKYVALVHGIIEEKNGEITRMIKRQKCDMLKMCVSDDKDSKFSVTKYNVLDRIYNSNYGNFTLVECILDTGKTHQIRVHMQSIGHPLAGDPIYNEYPNILGINRQFLHAISLEFLQPKTLEKLIIKDELADDLAHSLKKLKKTEEKF